MVCRSPPHQGRLGLKSNGEVANAFTVFPPSFDTLGSIAPAPSNGMRTSSHSFAAILCQNKNRYFVGSTFRPAIALEYDLGEGGRIPSPKRAGRMRRPLAARKRK